jgi:hypothetical protein
MFMNLAESGIFWQIWGNLAEYARFCQNLSDYQCENEKNMFLSNMDPQITEMADKFSFEFWQFLNMAFFLVHD